MTSELETKMIRTGHSLPSAADLDRVAEEAAAKAATAADRPENFTRRGPTPLTPELATSPLGNGGDRGPGQHLGPAPLADALPPTPDEIDASILFYKNAEACFETAKKTMDAEEEKLIQLVKKHGFRPDAAAQSLRLIGRRNTATVTIGRTVTLFQPAIQNFLGWCKRCTRMAIFGRLFTAETKYVAVEGWRDVLKSLSLSKRSEEKIASMVALCTDVKPKAPSLKVEVIKPEKVLRTALGASRKTKNGKAAA